ncbi:protein XRI1-like [Populus nigra]|uniref:protein XRI1-like n=1 Tax=Populus nigra TaxID=3691 RepID=UPI002B26DF9D|nr:protein XRI1-like [Populus nigra]
MGNIGVGNVMSTVLKNISMVDEVTPNGEDLSYMLDETTPVKACGDLACHVDHDGGVLEIKESLEEVLPQASQWDSGYQDISASSYNGLDQSSERWIAYCFNDSEMHFSPNNITKNLPGASDIQIDISGMKSFIQIPTKLAISVAYPFAFIKPCRVHGDVTLNEINQRIHTPPSKAKLKDEEPVVYLMSAFFGKPVVGKTKIRTEEGKGSITIMRTKGLYDKCLPKLQPESPLLYGRVFLLCCSQPFKYRSW